MKKKFRFLFCLFSYVGMLFLFSGCVHEYEVEQPAVRTVLAYIIGDNSLSGYASRNISSMMEGMQKDKSKALNLLVYVDDNSDVPALWKIERNKSNQVIKTPVRVYKEQNSVDPDIMKGIIQEAFSLYPASEKGLILWSHGSGWVPSSNYTLLSSPRKKAFGQDMYTGDGQKTDNWLELRDIRKVLEATGIHFNFLIFDACHMANVEVAYELRNCTNYMIASSTEIMGDGFPYTTIVPLMNQTKLDLAKIGEAYMELYDGSTDYQGGTISVINTSLLPALGELYSEVLSDNTRSVEELRSADLQEFGRWINSRTSYHDLFYDLRDYVALVSPQRLERLDALMERIIVFEGHTSQFGFTIGGGEKFDIHTSCGLTVFIPQLNQNERYMSAYKELQWYQDIH